MNPKVVYAAAGGIAAVAVAIFFLSSSISFRPQEQEVEQVMDPQVTIRNITATEAADRVADLRVAFDVHNPNRATMILETIRYSIYVDDFRMAIGDRGQSPEGFLAGQSGVFTIVSNTTITLRDTLQVERNDLNAESWEKMVASDAEYRVEGSYLYRVTGASLQTTADEGDFVMTFP